MRFDGADRTVDFDLCARGRSQAAPLCTTSRYVLAGDNLLPVVRQVSAGVVTLPLGRRSVDIAPVPIADSPRSECRLITAQNGRRIDAGCFEIVSSDIVGKGFSVRWRYRMTIARHP